MIFRIRSFRRFPFLSLPMEDTMKRILTRVPILASILLLAGFGQSGIESRIRSVEKGLLPPARFKGDATWTIEERMKHYKVPGLSVAVINNFKVEWVKAYGLKDIETKEPVSTETLFQAASISKPVTAMIALKKAQEGKISLDEDINNRLTSWKLPDNEWKKKVTLANLLTHTAGLTVHGFPGYAVSAQLPTVPQILDGVAPANTGSVRVDMEPGTKFRYSGGGTTIAQLAIMDREKKPYPQIAEETVFGPLKMTNSTYNQPLPDDWKKKAASGHKRDGNLVEGKIHIYPEMAPAGLWTTPTDLANFAIEVQLSLAGKSNKVLSKEMAEKMVTPFIEDFVGMGFFLEKHGQALYFGHGGSNVGFKSQLLVHKDKGYGVVVMINSDNAPIINEVIRSIAREYGWEDYLPAPYEIASIAPEKLAQYQGRYQIGPDSALHVASENAKIYLQTTEGPKFEIFPVSESDFVAKEENFKLTFVKNQDGKVDSIKIEPRGGSSFVSPRMADGTLIPYEKLMAGKIAEALEDYRRIRRERPEVPAIQEGRLNGLGYSLMRQKKMAEAIAIFKLNVEFYPKSSNVYDSLGEAYMTNGDKQLAITNYRKSLELNPKNDKGAQMLKKLENDR
jgi:CubicO group peptidase (beta-lactamase class C family)